MIFWGPHVATAKFYGNFRGKRRDMAIESSPFTQNSMVKTCQTSSNLLWTNSRFVKLKPKQHPMKSFWAAIESFGADDIPSTSLNFLFDAGYLRVKPGNGQSSICRLLYTPFCMGYPSSPSSMTLEVASDYWRCLISAHIFPYWFQHVSRIFWTYQTIEDF